MDPIIASMAKLNYFDAAHYTWIVLYKDVVMKHTFEEMNELLLAHGDYAAPLRTEELKMPFDNIALVLSGEEPDDDGRNWMLTVESVQGSIQTVTQWSGALGGNCRIAEFDFVSGRSEEGISNIVNNDVVYDTDWNKFDRSNGDPTASFRNKTAVRIDPRLDPDTCKELIKFLTPTIKTVLRYIAVASAGLLAGEQPTFHRPTGHSSNAKRVRKGKAPLYEWTTLQLERKTPELPAAPKGGTHASPRLHQRRGHWATSKLGKKFWRRESVVGDPEKGMIFHDYKGGSQDARP